MGAWTIASILFGCVFGSALLGIFLRSFLPAHNFSEESKDVVKLGTGLIATMAALVLGLMVASAKSSFDVQKNGVDQMSALIVLLDSTLAEYGPEAQVCRDTLREIVSEGLDRVWPEENDKASTFAPTTLAGSRSLYLMIQDLASTTDKQRRIQATALQFATDLARARWLLIAQEKSVAIPTPFLVVLVFWLAVLFASFGLFAPANPLVIGTLIVCALSVSGALFLILELAGPFDGMIQVSSTPLRNSLAMIGQ